MPYNSWDPNFVKPAPSTPTYAQQQSGVGGYNYRPFNGFGVTQGMGGVRWGLKNYWKGLMQESARPVGETLGPVYGMARTSLANQTAAGASQLASRFGGDTSDPTYAALAGRLSSGGAAGLAQTMANLRLQAESDRLTRMNQALQTGTQIWSTLNPVMGVPPASAGGSSGGFDVGSALASAGSLLNNGSGTGSGATAEPQGGSPAETFASAKGNINAAPSASNPVMSSANVQAPYKKGSWSATEYWGPKSNAGTPGSSFSQAARPGFTPAATSQPGFDISSAPPPLPSQMSGPTPAPGASGGGGGGTPGMPGGINPMSVMSAINPPERQPGQPEMSSGNKAGGALKAGGQALVMSGGNPYVAAAAAVISLLSTRKQ